MFAPLHAQARAFSRSAPQSHSSRQALAEYGRVSLESRVATASPHMLVQMLYERLAGLLHEARMAAAASDPARRLRATEKALALVDGLDATLDDERGGDVAQSLHRMYALLHERLLEGQEQGLSEAAAAMDEMAAAWRTIAPRAASPASAAGLEPVSI